MTALLRLSGLLLITGACLLVLLAPAAVAETPTGTSGASAPAAAPAETGSTSSSAPSQPETLTVEPAPTPPPASSKPSAPASPAAPRVHVQHAQHPSRGAPAAPLKSRAGHAPGKGTPSGAAKPNGPRAPSPSALTPPLPLAFSASLAGIPTFFIESFRIPPFLLPIFQAAGTAYGVPWQVLAAINEVETDYGRDLSISSAGAEGWMQFLPSSWAIYGVDANGDGFKDPYNPADAIFAAARYLRAAGAATDLRGAIFAYNHSRAYVESVLLRARLLGGTPTELLGALTGLTEARFPVHATSHFSDGFPAASGRTLAGTTIYSQPGAPVIAVQDGQISRIGDTRQLGHFVSLRDAYGNTYTYAQLGQVARLYPGLQPHEGSGASRAGTHAREAAEAAPKVPASAGVQPRVQASLAETPTISAPALGGIPGATAPPRPRSRPRE
ncbi:MAG TPA: lytic murein transglycosylase [Solirubrobacteraceae bacterium]|nr:lytic murein transglycosylase [Solirubrobacteraceae bacterium]